MAVKLFTLMLALLCAFQLYEAARLVPRSADSATTEGPSAGDVLAQAVDVISRTLDTWKEGADELLKGAPSVDNVVHNITTHLQTISGKVETAAKDLVESLTPSTAKP